MSCLGSNLFNFSSCPYSFSEINRRVSNGREEITIRTQLPLLSKKKSVTGSPSIHKLVYLVLGYHDGLSMTLLFAEPMNIAEIEAVKRSASQNSSLD